MEIAISSFGNKGDLVSERIGLKVLKDCELKFYFLFKTSFDDGGFYNRSDASFWFTPKKVKAGDKIVVYTKKGNGNVQNNEDGSTTYFFYWGLEQPIFVNDSKGVVLGELKDWQLSSKV